MSRAVFLMSVFVLVLLTSLSTSLSISLAAPAEKPNIIYPMLADAGYGDVGCYGQKHPATPHSDSLAKRGLKFTPHYPGSTLLAPTRG